MLLMMATPLALAASGSDVCMTHADASLAALVKGDFPAVTKHFSPADLEALPPARLQGVWQQLQQTFGTYQGHGDSQWQSFHGRSVVATRLRFAQAPLDFLVACDAANRITLFYFSPHAAAASPAPIQPHAEADGIRVEPLAVSSPFGPLRGALTLPVGDGPFPAVVLVSGSGPNDLDETVGPNKPFRDIANGLARAGIASLRYDKRTRDYGLKTAANPGFTVDDEVTDDALTALHLLAEQKQVDPRRVFVLGHSLGGMMAPRIAGRDPQLAGLILLAAPVRMDFNQILRQMRYIARVEHLPAASLDKQIAPIVKARDALAHADPAHPPKGTYFHAPASYWLGLRDYHPLREAKALHKPMLILQGASDYQVLPEQAFAIWKKPFANDPRVKLIEYPGLGHLFMAAGNPPSPADYAKPGHVDPEVIADIADWIKTQPVL